MQGRTILEGKQSSAKCCFRYLVGVYDPDKGRLEVVDPGGAAATANLFSLQRRLRGDALEGGVSKLSKEEAREALVDGFGSKRVKATHKKRKGQQLEVRIARASFSAPLFQKYAHSMRERVPRQSLTRSCTRLHPPQEEGSEAMESLEKTLRVRKQEADAVKVLLKRDGCAQPPVMRMLVSRAENLAPAHRTPCPAPPSSPAARPPPGWTRRWTRTVGPMNWRRRRTWQVMCRACTCAAMYGVQVCAGMLADWCAQKC